MLQLTDELEMFLRRQYPGHLCEDSNCPHHSYKHAFGGENHHLSRCKYCNHAHIHLSTHFFIDPPNRSHSRSLTHSLTHAPSHSLAHSLTHSFAHSFILPLSHSLIYPRTHSLTHSFTLSLPPARSFVTVSSIARFPFPYLSFLLENNESQALDQHCAECDAIPGWIGNILRLIETMGALPEGNPNTKESIKKYFEEVIILVMPFVPLIVVLVFPLSAYLYP